jgi:hypothetical protein
MKHARCCALRAIRLTELWIDDAPGERRTALVENGAIVEIHIQREPHLALGATGNGRIDRKRPSGAYVISDGGDELLVRRKTGQPEGTRVCFEVIREEICEPGRAKPAEARLLDAVAFGRLDWTASAMCPAALPIYLQLLTWALQAPRMWAT